LMEKIVNILHQTVVYAAAFRTDLRLSLSKGLKLCFPKPYLCPVYQFSSPNLQTCLKSQSDTVPNLQVT
jgi:hypothetical protein